MLLTLLLDIMEGADIANPLVTASIQYILNVMLTLPAIIYLDRFGRRKAMLIGSLLMMTFLFIAGGLQAGYGEPNDTDRTRTEQNKNLTWVVYKKRGVSSAIVAMVCIISYCSYSCFFGYQLTNFCFRRHTSSFVHLQQPGAPHRGLTQPKSSQIRFVRRLSPLQPLPIGSGTVFLLSRSHRC